MKTTELKSRDRDLFRDMGKLVGDLSDPENAPVLEKIQVLVNDLIDACYIVEFKEDYAWLSEAIVVWKSRIMSSKDDVVPPELPTPRMLPLKSRTSTLPAKANVGTPSQWAPDLRVDMFNLLAYTTMSSVIVEAKFAEHILEELIRVPDLDQLARFRLSSYSEAVTRLWPIATRELTDIIKNGLDKPRELKVRINAFIDSHRQKRARLLDNIDSVSGFDTKSVQRNLVAIGCMELLGSRYGSLMKFREDQTFDSVVMPACRSHLSQTAGQLFSGIYGDVENHLYTPETYNEIEDLVEHRNVQMILVGCEAVGPVSQDTWEVICPAGSYQIATAGSNAGIPIFAIAESSRILARNEYQAHREIFLAKPPGDKAIFTSENRHRVEHPTYDAVPSNLIHMLITEVKAYEQTEALSFIREERD